MATAYLRVYEPLDAFSPTEQETWINQPQAAEEFDRVWARRWLIGTSLPTPDSFRGVEGAFIRRNGDQVLACPWRTRLRMLAGLIAFRDSVPDEVADAFVPAEAARRAAGELAAI